MKIGKWGYISSPYATTSTTPMMPVVNNLSANPGYEISKPIGTLNAGGEYVISNFDRQEFVSEGAFAEFQNVYLNDVLLEKDVDYTAIEGSTKITIKSQTMQTKAVNNSSNTIKAEFKNSQGEIKQATETFEVAFQQKVIRWQ